MPNTAELVLQLLLNSGLAQYPDPKLYQAATMLTPQERPTAPVTVYPKGMSKAAYDPAKHQIHVGGQGSVYKDKKVHRLAAALAHEGVHSKGNMDESAAYQQEVNTLKRLGEKDKDMLQVLSERAAGGPIVIQGK